MVAVREVYAEGVKLLVNHQEDIDLDIDITDVYSRTAKEI